LQYLQYILQIILMIFNKLKCF